jgi:hypothetical protein
MMTLTKKFLICALLVSIAEAQAGVSAEVLTGHSHDFDIGGSTYRPDAEVPLQLAPDRIESANAGGPLEIQVLRENHGVLEPVLGLPMITHQEECLKAGVQSTHIEIPLLIDQIEISNGSEDYKIAADIPCQGTSRLIFRSDSNGGQVLGIWQIAYRAKTKLEAEVGLSFWRNPVTFVWPDEGDYYSWGQVHITRGDHWDVVGHELGHAIYDLGKLGTFGGGQHKIDECYGADLALSEGWASFFSGWLSVDLADPDAKFEFMVPRRAPIRFETVPSDVCKGEKNEWRVTGFFWDLLDWHDDGEVSQVGFAKIWNSMQGSQVSSATAAKDRIKRAGMNPSALQLIWDLNF